MNKQKFEMGSSADTAYELKNVLELQLLYVSALFDPFPKDPGEAIHEARRSYKKCRAILRLMRDALGYAIYYRENARLRNMQRALSQVRDSDVQCQLFKQLAGNFPEFGRKAWFGRIIEQTERNYHLEMKHFRQTGKAADISHHTRLKAAQIQQYALTGEGFEIIKGGLSRIYRQGREMGKMVFGQEADPFEVHAFRKKAKYLQYQLSYLSPISRELIAPMSAKIEQITENLGYYNDLQIARTSIQLYAEQNNYTGKKVGLLIGRLDEEMHRAKAGSKSVYEKMYVEEPGNFVSRIREYWESYENSH
jgi:CHAD domain-containing protein